MKTYTYVNKPGKYAFNRQEEIVFRALRELQSASIEELAARCEELGMKTKQTYERIVAYYMVDLKKLGLVTISGQTTGSRRVTIEISDDADETTSDDADETTSDAPDSDENMPDQDEEPKHLRV